MQDYYEITVHVNSNAMQFENCLRDSITDAIEEVECCNAD